MSFLSQRYYQRLVQHRLYRQLNSLDRVRAFSERYVICAWSYHTILKKLQQELFAALQPFGAESIRDALQLISQLILEEEVGQTADGRYVSLFELYLEALQDIGADANQFLLFMDALDSGKSIYESARLAYFSPAMANYVAHVQSTLSFNPLHKAITLLYETEPYMPYNFVQQVNQLSKSNELQHLLSYFHLHSHHQTNNQTPSPLAQLVSILGGDSEFIQHETDPVAELILQRRIELWDEISESIDQLPQGDLRETRSSHLRLVR